jgi:hypothetical protein
MNYLITLLGAAEGIADAVEVFGGSFDLDQAIAFTFFIGSMAMMGATAFFWLEMRNVTEKWIRFDYIYCSSTLLLHERLLCSIR